jgi:hypothetical protein
MGFRRSVVLVVLFSVFVSLGAACSVASAPLEVKTEEGTCSLDYFRISEERSDRVTALVNATEAQCGDIDLSSDDMDEIRAVLEATTLREQYGRDRPFLVKQSEEEYNSLLSKKERINADECNCKRYSSIHREGSWTFYVEEATCGLTSSCRTVKPASCGAASPTNTGILAVLTAVLATVMVYRNRSRWKPFLVAALSGAWIPIVMAVLAAPIYWLDRYGSVLPEYSVLLIGAAPFLLPLYHLYRSREEGWRFVGQLSLLYLLSIATVVLLVLWQTGIEHTLMGSMQVHLGLA